LYLASRFPGLFRTKVIFQDFSGPGNFGIKIPGLSRRHGNPVYGYFLLTACTTLAVNWMYSLSV